MTPKPAAWQPADHLSEPAPGVFFFEGPASNWTVVQDLTGFMLIDTGYPADCPLVLASIRHLGLDPEAALAVLITHGHVDHTGSASHFATAYGTPILCAPEELAHVHGREKHQVTFGQVLVRAWRPRVLRWMLHAIKAGALKAGPAKQARAWDEDSLRTLPGRPAAIPVPGHTPGNAAINLQAAGAIAVGDCFVTGHPLSRRTGPQMLHPMYHSDPAAALEATQRLAGVAASVILPGHGPALRLTPADALALLR